MHKPLKQLRHLSEYGAFIIFSRILKLFGIDKAADICSFVARKIGPFSAAHKIAKQNLKVLNIQESEEKIILENLWDNFGRFIGEMPYVSTMPAKELSERVEIIGLEHLAEYQKHKRPFLLFTGHFANWDFALKITDKLYHKFGIIYRKANNPYVDKAINHHRSAENVHLIAKGPYGAKDLIKAIKSGYSIAMLVDQKMNDGIEVPFFGKPAMTPHAIAKFALQFHYPIIPCQIVRTKGSYFQVVIYPPLDVENTGNVDADCYTIMNQVNLMLEDWIRQNPSQWFWFHNRWKK